MKPLTTSQLSAWKHANKDFLLLNVLDRPAFEKRHIPGSQNVPVNSSGFETATEKLAGSKQKPVVVYCADSECNASSKAAAKLDAAGFDEVYEFDGGMKAWNDASQPVASGSLN